MFFFWPKFSFFFPLLLCKSSNSCTWPNSNKVQCYKLQSDIREACDSVTCEHVSVRQPSKKGPFIPPSSYVRIRFDFQKTVATCMNGFILFSFASLNVNVTSFVYLMHQLWKINCSLENFLTWCADHKFLTVAHFYHLDFIIFLVSVLDFISFLVLSL